MLRLSSLLHAGCHFNFGVAFLLLVILSVAVVVVDKQ